MDHNDSPTSELHDDLGGPAEPGHADEAHDAAPAATVSTRDVPFDETDADDFADLGEGWVPL